MLFVGLERKYHLRFFFFINKYLNINQDQQKAFLGRLYKLKVININVKYRNTTNKY